MFEDGAVACRWRHKATMYIGQKYSGAETNSQEAADDVARAFTES